MTKQTKISGSMNRETIGEGEIAGEGEIVGEIWRKRSDQETTEKRNLQNGLCTEPTSSWASRPNAVLYNTPHEHNHRT